MNNLLITKENKKTKRFILVFLLFRSYEKSVIYWK